jgi:hypothetical protein
MKTAAERIAEAYTPSEDKIRDIENLMDDAQKSKLNHIYLPFEKYGYNWEDVEWINKYGYHVARNSACLWWKISWSIG